MTAPPTTDIAAWLTARLDEDEAAARYVGMGSWVAAMRRIVELHAGTNWGAQDGDPWPMLCDECHDQMWPCPTIRALASIYADHDDYDAERWAL